MRRDESFRGAHTAPPGAGKCDPEHGGPGAKRIQSCAMEWMLQVVDEVDDAICVVKHRWLGLRIELGVLLLLGIASAAVGTALAVGLSAAS